jgi:hypothetical protein
MKGCLAKYGPGASHVCFVHEPLAQKHLVLVGGLTDGLLFAPYTHQVAQAASKHGFSLVQAQLTSSYQARLDMRASPH